MQVKYKIMECVGEKIVNYGNRDEKVEYKEGQWIASCEATHFLYNTRRQAKIFLINQDKQNLKIEKAQVIEVMSKSSH